MPPRRPSEHLGEVRRDGDQLRLHPQAPGLVGSAPAWLHASEELESVFRAGEWLAVEGEPGVGKLALLNAVQLRRQPVGRLSVLDADEAGPASWGNTLREALLVDADSVVVRHVDRLSDPCCALWSRCSARPCPSRAPARCGWRSP